jgi:hypothetical protein
MATTDEGEPRVFKRMNFFKGMITSESDWIEEQQYRMDKQRLHNRALHGPGVVRADGDGLRVHARGDLSLEILPGVAIDGAGNELCLWEPVIKSVSPDYKNQLQLYVVLRYGETPTDFIAYKKNLAIRGHRRMMEIATVEIIEKEPDIKKEVELARVLVEPNARALRDQRGDGEPKPNEVTMNYVRRAGVVGSKLVPSVRMRLTQVLQATRRAFILLGRDGKVKNAHDVVMAVVQVSSLHICDMVDRWNIFDALNLIVEQMNFVAVDIHLYYPKISSLRQFTDYRQQVELLRGVVKERRAGDDVIDGMLTNLQRATDIIASMFQSGSPGAGARTQIGVQRY